MRRRLIWKFLADQSGATAIEYAIIAGGLSIVIVVAVNGLHHAQRHLRLGEFLAEIG